MRPRAATIMSYARRRSGAPPTSRSGAYARRIRSELTRRLTIPHPTRPCTRAASSSSWTGIARSSRTGWSKSPGSSFRGVFPRPAHYCIPTEHSAYHTTPKRNPFPHEGADTTRRNTRMQSAYVLANRGLIDRAKNILATPKTEWPIIQAETTDAAQLYTGYVIPLAAFSAVMCFILMSLIGVRYWHMPVLTGLVYALANFGFALLGIYLLGLIIDALAPSFAGQRNQRQALKTAAYAFTPAALSAVLGLLPAIGLLSALRVLLQLIACLYGI